jgi:hypothetical protein
LLRTCSVLPYLFLSTNFLQAPLGEMFRKALLLGAPKKAHKHAVKRKYGQAGKSAWKKYQESLYFMEFSVLKKTK